MIDHVSIGVRDIAKAKRFYDAALKPLGYQCLSQGEGSLGYGRGAVALWIGATEHPVPVDMKSGLHFYLTAPTRDSVDAFHSAALKTGGRDNGTPGLRADYGPAITLPLSSTPTATGSRRIAINPRPDLARPKGFEPLTSACGGQRLDAATSRVAIGSEGERKQHRVEMTWYY